MLNGQHLSIGYNLWLLLKQLRRAGKHGLRWVGQHLRGKCAGGYHASYLLFSLASFRTVGEKASTGVQSSDLAFELEAGSDAILKKLNEDQEDGPPTDIRRGAFYDECQTLECARRTIRS